MFFYDKSKLCKLVWMPFKMLFWMTFAIQNVKNSILDNIWRKWSLPSHRQVHVVRFAKNDRSYLWLGFLTFSHHDPTIASFLGLTFLFWKAIKIDINDCFACISNANDAYICGFSWMEDFATFVLGRSFTTIDAVLFEFFCPN